MIAAASAILAVSSWSAPAGAQVWTGTTSNDWTIGGNWSTGTPPTGTATVTINTNTPNPTVLGVSGATAATIGNLQLGAAAGTSALTIQNGSTLSSSLATGTNYIGRIASVNSTLTVTGPGSSWSTAASTFIGAGNSSNGTLNIANGATVTMASIGLGQGGATGNGNINITGGGTLTSGAATFFAFNSHSTANVSGAGSRWNVSGVMTIGSGRGGSGTGSGVLNVTGGAAVTATGAITIGGPSLSAAGTGMVTVSGSGSQLSTSAAINVGAFGQGTLTVSDSALVTANAINMTSLGASVATLNVSAGGALATQALTAGPGTVHANFDGATLRATGSNTAFISGFTGTALNVGAGGLTLDTGNFTVTAASPFSGVGALTKVGTGTAILTGDNVYTGGTTISAGTVQLGNGGTSGSLAGDVTNNGTLAFNRSDAVSFNGAISGTGAVIHDGSGTTTFTAANTYTGPTTVNAGTLLINGDQSAATGATVVNGGRLGGAGTIGGNVSVADGATLAPGAASGTPGTLTIKGNLSLASGSVLDYDFGQPNVVGGALNDLVSVAGDVTLGGTINVAESAGGSFGPGVYRIISYGGNLLGGTLAMGVMPGDGITTVQTSIANQINLVNTAATPLTFWDGDAGGRNDGVIHGGDGTWRAAGGANWTTAAGDASGPYANGGFPIFAGTPGTVTVDDSAGAVRASGMQFATGGYTLQGDAITLTGADATIRVGDGTADGAGYVATIAAPLTGNAGLSKTDLGTLVLGGASSYTGATTVAGGTLVVNGSIANSAVTAQAGTTLAGTGTVGAATVASGAAIAPGGNAIGTLTVNGDYAQQAGASYQAQLDPASTAADRIAVAGAATLSEGAAINVARSGNGAYVPGTRYTVLSAANGLQGAFTLAGDTALSAFLTLTSAYDANNAYLSVQQSRAIDTAAQSSNQSAVANGVDSLPADNAVKTAVVNTPDDTSARNALNRLSGEIHASMQTAALQDSRFVRDAATDRMREAFCGVGSEGDRRDAGTQTADGAPYCGSRAQGPTGWTRVFGSWQHNSSDGNAGAMDDSTSGIFVGVDTAVSQNWRVGVMTGYSHSEIDVDSRKSSGSSDNYHLGVYGGAQWGAVGLRTGATYTWQDVSTSRSVNVAGLSQRPEGDYQARVGQIFGDLGYRIDAGRFSYEPFVNVAYVNLDTDSFTEKGGAAALHGRGDSRDVTFSTLGLRGTAAITLGGMDATLRGSLGWRHAFGDDTPVSTLQFQDGQRFSLAGVPIAQDAAVIDAGLSMNLTKRALLGVSYGAQLAGGSTAQSVQATLRVQF